MTKPSRKILIVEDDAQISALLEGIIKDCAIDSGIAMLIEKYDNAFDALESCIEKAPNLMTLDLNLNIKNAITGYELPRILHNRYKLFFPITIVSGESKDFVDKAHLDYNHITMYKISKPFDIDYMKILFKKILQL